MHEIPVHSFYRHPGVPLVANAAATDWQRPGAASSTSTFPIWGHYIKMANDARHERTMAIAGFGIEWSQGSDPMAGIQLRYTRFSDYKEQVVGEITKDQYPTFDPETGGFWFNDLVQRILDEGEYGFFQIYLRRGVKIYGAHLYLFTYQVPTGLLAARRIRKVKLLDDQFKANPPWSAGTKRARSRTAL